MERICLAVVLFYNNQSSAWLCRTSSFQPTRIFLMERICLAVVLFDHNQSSAWLCRTCSLQPTFLNGKDWLGWLRTDLRLPSSPGGWRLNYVLFCYIAVHKEEKSVGMKKRQPVPRPLPLESNSPPPLALAAALGTPGHQIRGCSHITSAKIRGSWAPPALSLRQKWSAFGLPPIPHPA